MLRDPIEPEKLLTSTQTTNDLLLLYYFTSGCQLRQRMFDDKLEVLWAKGCSLPLDNPRKGGLLIMQIVTACTGLLLRHTEQFNSPILRSHNLEPLLPKNFLLRAKWQSLQLTKPFNKNYKHTQIGYVQLTFSPYIHCLKYSFSHFRTLPLYV